MDLKNLNSFLKFGYFLDYKNPDYTVDFSGTDKSCYLDAREPELIDTGIALWEKAIGNKFSSSEKHVVPLSGGLDSRAILATLLKYTDAANIRTYTFGTPGTLDYEIGKRISRYAGTEHVSFDLRGYEYDLNEMIDISRRTDHQTLLFLHPRITEIDTLFGNGKIWSGALIDVFFGRHTHQYKSDTWEEAFLNSFRENYYTKSTDITNVSESDLYGYIEYDPGQKGVHILEHVIDLMNRQVKFIAPIVLIKGYDYNVLFDDKELTDFAFSIGDEWHEHQYLYKKMFLKAYPKFFSFPTKGNHGCPLDATPFRIRTGRILNAFKRGVNGLLPSFPDPGINYVNFNRAIRINPSLNKIVFESIMDLRARKILDWVEIDHIWKQHIGNRANHADVLLTLASLEIHLKAGKKL